jgi:UDP-glucuronate 4-epimerase
MILVTGAAGFIGSHLVERLLADGRRVLGVDNFDAFYARPVKERNLAAALGDPRFRLVEADIRDAAALAGAAACAGEPIEAIVHLAARANVRASLEDPVGFHETNVVGTLRVFELARACGVPRVVFGSSSSVYGLNPRVPWREDDCDLQPISPYASSKLAGEAAARVYARVFGLAVVALRFFTVYGPRQRPDLAIAKFSRLVRSGRPVPLFGDGSTRRDYTYVADIVDGIARAIEFRGAPFEAVNLGNHETVGLGEMVAAIGRAFGVEPAIDRQPEQPGDVPRTWADVSKAKRLLGWAPRTAFEDGLRRYRAWLDAGEAR